MMAKAPVTSFTAFLVASASLTMAAVTALAASLDITPAYAVTQQFREPLAGTGSVADGGSPLSVVSVTPADGASDVNPEAQVVLTFSASVDSLTVTSDTIGILAGDQALSAYPNLYPDGVTVVLDTYGGLQPGVRHTVFVTSGVTDLAGNPATPFRSSFVVAQVDTQGPWVVEVRPPYWMTNVPINRTVSLFFNEPLAPSTLSGHVYLSANGDLVPQSITLAGLNDVVVLTPTTPLAFATLHQVFVTTGVTDLTGNPASQFDSSFTTVADPATVPPQVIASSPDPYGSASPLNTRVAVQFSKAMNPATITTTAFQVLSGGYGGDPIAGTVTLDSTGTVAAFAPSSDLSPATYYGIHVASAAQDLSGMPLQEFYSDFQTGTSRDDVVPTLDVSTPAAGATGIALNAKIRARFSKPINPATVTAGTFAVRAAGVPVVPMAVDVSSDGRVVTFTPMGPLAAATAHTLTIAAALTDTAGHSLPGAPVVTTFTTGNDTDFVAPQVTTNPPQGAQNVPTNTVLQASFSEPIDPISFDPSAVQLMQDATYQQIALAASFDATNRILTLVPQQHLYVGTQHELSVGGSLTDLAGNPFSGGGTSFTAAFSSDTTAPTIVGTSPANNATGVPVNAHVTVRFSEAVNPVGITPATFSVTATGGAVAGSLAVNEQQAIFTPDVPFAANTAYTATVAGTITDIAGNPLGVGKTFAFTTGPTVDLTTPYIVSHSPDDGDIGVARMVVIALQFSEPIDPLTVNQNTVQLTKGSTPVAVTLTLDPTGTIVYMTPTAPLQSLTTYTVQILSGIADRGGNVLGYSYPFSFTTGAQMTVVPTSTPTSTPTITPWPTITKSPTSPVVATATPTPTNTRTPSPAPSPTQTVTPTRRPTPSPQPLVTLSGTVHYSGSLGPVSSAQPIRMSVHTDANLNDDPPDRAVITTNGGAFTLRLPVAGNYYLGYSLDVGGNGKVSVGAPFELYNNRFTLPATALPVPQSGISQLALDFGDTGLIPGVSGTISYEGSEESPSDSRQLRVYAYSDSNLTDRVGDKGRSSTNGGRYALTTLDTTPLYLLAFFDTKGNGDFDSDEPFQIYNKLGTPPGDAIVPSPTQTNINFLLRDQPPTQRLKGTINYTGSRGTVSADTPIQMYMFDTPSGGKGGNQVDQAVVASNSGSFALGAPSAGSYYLAYVLDLNDDGHGNVGEPFSIYNNKPNFPGDPITVPQSTVTLSFGDTTIFSGIAGTVSYIGDHGVSDQRPIIVQAFTDSLLRFEPKSTQVSSNGGRYDLVTLDTATYYLQAFLDLNGNGQLDDSEPFGVYNKRDATHPDAVAAGPTQTAINIVFGDTTPAARLTGTIQYSGSQGPVSSTRPMVLYLFSDPNANNSPIDQAFVTGNGGSFVLGAPAAGNYYLAYLLEIGNRSIANASPTVGDPFAIYNNKLTFPGNALAIPGSVNLSFGDSGKLPGVSGTVIYTGNQGPIAEHHALVVEAFSTPDLSGDSVNNDQVTSNGGRYSIVSFDTSNLYLRAFLDLNDNWNFDPGEPYEIYNNHTAPPADAVVPGSSQTGINFQFGDENAAIRGFIHYSGALGPVSDTQPILVSVFSDAALQNNMGSTDVSTNAGRFDIPVGPGTYYLSYLLDLDNDGQPSVGEPQAIYNGQTATPGDGVTVPQAGLLNLDFGDIGRLSGIAGTVTYTGSHGQVSSGQRLVVQAFRDPNLTNLALQSEKTTTNAGRYDLVTFNDTSTYYLRAFLDLNGNRVWDQSEPYTIYRSKGVGQPADPVVAAPTQTGINISFGDETPTLTPTTPVTRTPATSTPTPTATVVITTPTTPTPSASPTRSGAVTTTPTVTPTSRPCVGDCDRDGNVTVDEILTLVNIALGNRSVSDCQGGDFNGDNQITVDEILKAVNNALNGCG